MCCSTLSNNRHYGVAIAYSLQVIVLSYCLVALVRSNTKKLKDVINNQYLKSM